MSLYAGNAGNVSHPDTKEDVKIQFQSLNRKRGVKRKFSYGNDNLNKTHNCNFNNHHANEDDEDDDNVDFNDLNVSSLSFCRGMDIKPLSVPMIANLNQSSVTRNDAKIITDTRLKRLKELSQRPEDQLNKHQKNEKKRIIRLEKNRRAASMSRRKKKMYVRNLEEKNDLMTKHLALLEMERAHYLNILQQIGMTPSINNNPHLHPQQRRYIQQQTQFTHHLNNNNNNKSSNISSSTKLNTVNDDRSISLISPSQSNADESSELSTFEPLPILNNNNNNGNNMIIKQQPQQQLPPPNLQLHRFRQMQPPNLNPLPSHIIPPPNMAHLVTTTVYKKEEEEEEEEKELSVLEEPSELIINNFDNDDKSNVFPPDVDVSIIDLNAEFLSVSNRDFAFESFEECNDEYDEIKDIE